MAFSLCLYLAWMLYHTLIDITTFIPSIVSMDSKRIWKILNWNLRGINSEKKWVALSQKILESECEIICLQETKREDFDDEYIRKFCPKKLNKFDFLPSAGASRGDF